MFAGSPRLLQEAFVSTSSLKGLKLHLYRRFSSGGRDEYIANKGFCRVFRGTNLEKAGTHRSDNLTSKGKVPRNLRTYSRTASRRSKASR